VTAICCYGDSNTWGYEASTEDRLQRWRRWPGVMQRELGDDVHVIEEGLNGRTTVFEDPFEPGRNGLAHLPVVLKTHAPLDLVIIWLGTNDLFVPGGLTAQDAARGAITLAEIVRASDAGPDDEPPEVLVLVSPPFGPLGVWEHDSPHGELESRGFADAFRRLAEEAGCRCSTWRRSPSRVRSTASTSRRPTTRRSASRSRPRHATCSTCTERGRPMR
jgi:lysophospholipase L1-like esterase